MLDSRATQRCSLNRKIAYVGEYDQIRQIRIIKANKETNGILGPNKGR